ncbi:MAG: dUTP diphosphatase [Thermincola sp.]|jgi:dUTP pyrophosphatase|nr:dUTP diphosphatase [Thermincola sp.]MDT3701724.1 dUTP diphosphatase [Thermincola sp.]
MERVSVKVKRTAGCEDLPLPQYMTQGAAGMDLYAAVTQTEVINPGQIKLVPTGLSLALPEGYEAQIRPRSGLALKYGITMVNSPGTIDADYRGEIGLIMINHGQAPFEIKRGDRVAQMVINQIAQAEFLEVDNLDSTLRSAGGFGSTGKQ